MEDKPVISNIDVSFTGVKKGELVITENEVVLYKRKSLFGSRSVIKRISLASLTGVQLDKYRLKLDGNKESGEVYVESIDFEYKSEIEKVQKHLQEYLDEKARKTQSEAETAKAKEERRQEQAERYRKFILENRARLWYLAGGLFHLCGAIPREDWDNIKRIVNALQNEFDAFVKLNALEKEAKLPNFRELAEKEELAELEKAAAALLEYLITLLEKDAPQGTPPSPEGDKLPAWNDLKYHFLYASLLGEAGLCIALDEPGELYQTAARLETISPIVAEKFGVGKDKAPAASLRLPHANDEAAAILNKLVAELDSALPRAAEGNK